MGNDVAGQADARFSENSDSGVCSPLRVQAGKLIPATGDGLRNGLAPARLGAVADRRRTAALELGVDHLLVEATARAAEQLKTTWPELSAATLKLPVRMIPLLVGLLAVVTIVVAPGVTRILDGCRIAGSISYLDCLVSGSAFARRMFVFHVRRRRTHLQHRRAAPGGGKGRRSAANGN